MGAAVPTLAAYLSRALEGSDFPSALFLLWPRSNTRSSVGVGSLVARQVLEWRGARDLLLVAYIAAQLGAHIMLNQQAVNLRLLADPNPGVSNAAVTRLAASGDGGAVPALQDRFMQAFEDTATPMKP